MNTNALDNEYKDVVGEPVKKPIATPMEQLKQRILSLEEKISVLMIERDAAKEVIAAEPQTFTSASSDNTAFLNDLESRIVEVESAKSSRTVEGKINHLFELIDDIQTQISVMKSSLAKDVAATVAKVCSEEIASKLNNLAIKVENK